MATQVGRSLDEIVRDYMLEEERDSLHKYPFYLKYAISGLRDLTFDISGAPKKVQLEVDESTNVVALPPDFIKEIRVGVIIDGVFVSLGQNSDIIKKLDDCGNVATNQNNSTNLNTATTAQGFSVANTWHQHYRNGEVIGAYYGIGGHQGVGQFYINYDAGRIEFSTITNQSNVVLEYVSDLSTVNGDFRVHPFLEEPILNYIDWVSKRRKHKQYGAGMINDLQRKYVDSKIWAAIRIGSSTKAQVREVSKKNFTLAPKGL
jgi:hypothetical protein